jgi:hypothetical protein
MRPDCKADITQLCVCVCLTAHMHTVLSVRTEVQEISLLTCLTLLQNENLAVSCILQKTRFEKFLKLKVRHNSFRIYK